MKNMATYNIKKEKERIIVEVIVPPLPHFAREARLVKETVVLENVEHYLKRAGIDHLGCMENTVVRNGESGIFIFRRSYIQPSAQKENEVSPKKDLTPPPEPVIIEEQPKKRKRVKRVSKTGNKTTS